jgi:hypothetical protein
MSLPEQLAELERRIRARHDAAVTALRQEYETRLRRVSEDLLAGLGDVASPAFQPLTEADAAAVVPPPPSPRADEALGRLVDAARALEAATNQAGVLEALLASARRFAERTGLLLVRADGLTGWASSGFDGDPFAARQLAWQDGLPSAADLGRGAVRLEGAEARRFADQLGLAAAPERAVLVPLVLRDRLAAALYADGAAEGQAPELGALQLLVLMAGARLELQPLSDRRHSPTLFEAAETVAEPLPPWVAEPEPAAPPEEIEAAPAAIAEVELAAAPTLSEPEPAWQEPEPLPALEPEVAWQAPEPLPTPEPEATWQEPDVASAEAPGEPPRPAWAMPEPEAVQETPREDLAAAPIEPSPAAPALEDSLWGAGARIEDAAAAGFAVEAEPPPLEPAPEPTAAPSAQVPEPPAAPEPALSEATVRIPAFRPAPPPPAPPEPAAPPFVATQRVPQATTPGAPAPPPVARDATEDATVLVRPGAAPPPPLLPSAPEEEVTERTAVRGGVRTTEVAPPPDVSGPGLAFAAGRAPRTSSENALHDEARRLARLLVSEIKLYNEEQVLEGRRNRDLYVRLREDIDRSRQIYEERVHESVRSTSDYFHQELVRSLAGGDPRALGL